jgi:hypothetical protein
LGKLKHAENPGIYVVRRKKGDRAAVLGRLLWPQI